MSEMNSFTPGEIHVSESFGRVEPSVESVFEKYVEYFVESFYRRIFKGKILPRQVYRVTGDNPFPAHELRKLLQKLGLDEFTAPDGAEWDYIEAVQPIPDVVVPAFAIVGREGFDEEALRGLLRDYREEGIEYFLFFSQEDFLNYWLFGIKPNYVPGDVRIENHPGLKFLASASDQTWPWPSTEANSGINEFDDSNLSQEHPLKARFGYSVQVNGPTDSERQKILDSALTASDNPLSLYEVVTHITWLVRTRKNMKRRNFESAIAKWETDLAYLKRTYYHKQFKWPPTKARSW